MVMPKASLNMFAVRSGTVASQSVLGRLTRVADNLVADSSYISNVARTISHAFAHDPLIQWLRPNAELWNTLTPEICKWQYRRIQRAILDGEVFAATIVGQHIPVSSQTAVKKHNVKVIEAEKPLQPTSDAGSDACAVVMLFPPNNHMKWTIQRIWLACKLWIMDCVDEASDDGTSMPRLEKLLVAHDKSLDMIRSRYNIDDLWYLEVIAVHPHMQARGIGGQIMKWLLDYLRGKPIALECTAENNIAFYERFGFKVVEEVELVDESSSKDDSTTKYWVMFRDRQT